MNYFVCEKTLKQSKTCQIIARHFTALSFFLLAQSKFADILINFSKLILAQAKWNVRVYSGKKLRDFLNLADIFAHKTARYNGRELICRRLKMKFYFLQGFFCWFEAFICLSQLICARHWIFNALMQWQARNHWRCEKLFQIASNEMQRF